MLDSSPKKLIVFKIPEFPHISETFIVAQVITAIKMGYDVKILVRKLVTTNAEVCSGLIEEYGLLEKVIVEDYKIPVNKAYRLLTWIQILIFNFKHLSHIIKYYKAHSKFSLTWLFEWRFYKQFNDATIFHVQYGTNHKPIAVLKKINFFKPQTIVTFHGHDAFFPLYGYIPNNNYYKTLFENDILITANTPYLASKIEGLGCPNEKIRVIPVGVDTSFFYPKKIEKNKEKQLKLITVGRLDEIKGHRYCIEAVNQLIRAGIEVSLTIIGEGAERINLEHLIATYNLEKHVFMKGAKSPDEVRQQLWKHDVYMLLAVPLIDGRRETQGLATLEAQACGLPAIVFDSGGVKYTVEDKVTGYICKEFDVEDVINKIKLLALNPDSLSEMGANAIEFVDKKFSQKVIDNKWANIYRKFMRDD
ncbi:glycosyltransferase family 4 protein [Algibacter sp. 2305UL17-15]|uniref:glycosyltransferase family 4 protein n=1 Tax=Algibacter sp. 2305UL17-15 TaxID=3231268 RepID=UPI003458AED7